MCGIAGLIGNGFGESAQQEALLNRMLHRIHHRGPDECGLFLSPEASFGAVRLSIVDLLSGQQPMGTPCGRYWIAYNGEVFNHVDLRNGLIAQGHCFRTHCDTEVVLHLFQEYGERCLTMMNGQFAFVVWDVKEKKLFMARDRMGIRPLFYHKTGNGLVFGSEIKSLFEVPGVERSISPFSLKQVFSFWSTIAPNTIFNEVFEIPAGHFAVFCDGNLTVSPYWDLRFASEASSGNITINDAAARMDDLLSDAVSLRMKADVQVAAYLSGGLDSSTLVAYIKRLYPDVLNTFSIGFEEPEFDESVYQNEVSGFFGTNHTSVLFHNSDIPTLLESVLWHAETPLLRTGPLPMYKLSKLVRDSGIKVVVTGEGADEMLAGYNIFKEALVRRFWARYPDSRLRPLLLKKLYRYIPQLHNASPQMLKLFFGYQLDQVTSPVYSHMLRWKTSSGIAKFLSDDMIAAIGTYDPVAGYADSIADDVIGCSPLAKAQYIESKVFLSGYLLSSQGDRVSMGNSVEGRYPFLDYRLVEFCATLPDEYKLKGFNEKYLLKHIMKGRIPESVTKRDKQPYRAPIATALRSYGGDLMDRYLSESAIKQTNYFNSETVGLLMAQILAKRDVTEFESMALMAILSVQIVDNLFVRQPPSLGEVRKGRVMNAL